MKISMLELVEELRMGWPSGACSLFVEIVDYSGSCGRCGWSIEDHEYLLHLHEVEDAGGNIYQVFVEDEE